MNTLMAQRDRLETEVAEASAAIENLRAEGQPDLRAIKQLNESIVRNKQLISMIENHLGCGNLPMWRAK